VSLVVPVYNEAATVQTFVDSVAPVLAAAQVRAEIVFVNDGSSDDTLDTLLRLQEADDRVRVVNLSRNFGKEAALTAGLEISRGDVVVPIDVDLQDPPELLLPFLERWRDGYDVVYGIRRSRSGDPLLMRFTARWFYKTFNLVSPTSIPEDVGDFRLMDRRVVESILQMGERSRFMKGLFSWVGFPSVGVEFERPERSGGATTWTAWRRWNFALDGIASFSAAPLRIWTYLGLAIAAGCGIYGLVILTLALLGEVDAPGYASLILVILFLGAMQLVSLGLIGEYLGRVLTETKRRPLYLLEGVYEALSAQPPASGAPEPPQAATAPAPVELAGAAPEGDRRGP
jgi:glycosyltransferase involved in cell wall biosynthesis